MANFQKAINILLGEKNIPGGSEGGYANNPLDPGGATNFGLSKRYLNGFKNSEFDDNHDGHVSDAEVKDIKKPESIAHYKREWWDKYGYDRINSDDIAAKLFDEAVNFGQAAAVKLMQKSCNKIMLPKYIPEDGIMGPMTINAINKVDILRLIGLFRLNCSLRYQQILKKNPRLEEEFKNGWLQRAMR